MQGFIHKGDCTCIQGFIHKGDCIQGFIFIRGIVYRGLIKPWGQGLFLVQLRSWVSLNQVKAGTCVSLSADFTTWGKNKSQGLDCVLSGGCL